MAEKKFTLFEVHLGDGNIQFGPKVLRGGRRDDEDESEEFEDESSGGRSLLPFVLALAVLVGVAFAAKRFVGVDDAELDELEELDAAAK